MKANMGNIDRALRVVAAAIIGVLYFTGIIGGKLALVLGILAVIFLVTSLVKFCPLYYPFKLSTKKQ